MKKTTDLHLIICLSLIRKENLYAMSLNKLDVASVVWKLFDLIRSKGISLHHVKHCWILGSLIGEYNMFCLRTESAPVALWFLQVSSLTCFSILMMKAIPESRNSAKFRPTTRRYIQKFKLFDWMIRNFRAEMFPTKRKCVACIVVGWPDTCMTASQELN